MQETKVGIYMKKQLKKITAGCLVAAMLLASVGVFAMDSDSTSLSTAEFDSGMAKGIWYFNKGMYYEAKDEFQWFCDYNWGKMNVGQQKYALDYLGATRGRIKEYESIVHLEYGAPLQYGGLYHITANEAIRLIKVVYGVSTYYVGTSNVFFQFYGEGREFRVNRWYNTPAVTVDEVIIPLF